MGILREQINKILDVFGLYEPFRELWLNRRVYCWNVGYRLAGAKDGLPIPPGQLRYLVAGTREISWFLTGGTQGSQCITRILRSNGINIEDFDRILDFGCGCGRIHRNWHSLKGPRLFGTDYNPKLVHWCQSNLGGLADFRTNDLSPPLDHNDDFFDFIYVISVFTHIGEGNQSRWMREFLRILKDGGILLITTHGKNRLHELSSEELQIFNSGQLVVKNIISEGTNRCATYHPEQYVRSHLVRGFEIVDFVPRGARDADQDVWLLRKTIKRN